MNIYNFKSRAGEWSLDFPNDNMAIYHAKMHNASVSQYGIVLAEYVWQDGIRIFKIHKEIVS